VSKRLFDSEKKGLVYIREEEVKKVNILLINDDGYQSVMTKKLKEHLVALGHNVYSFLPENDYSGAGSSISFGQDIHYRV